MLTFFACQETGTEDPTDHIDHTTSTYSIPAMLNDGLEFIRNRDSYLIHTMMEIDADYYTFFTKHRYQVLFSDTFLKANEVNDTGEIYSRVGIIDDKAYTIYKQGTTWIKGDELDNLQRLYTDYDHIVFGLLKSSTIDQFTIQENVATVSYTYEEMLTKNPFILDFIDDWMSLEIDEATDIDLSNVTFDVTITMNDTNPNSFNRISIDMKDYLTLKFPLQSIPQDYYRDAKLIYEFSYGSYEKDITSSTPLVLDDHPNRLSDQAAVITINQDMTTLGQYQYDFDWFKITLTETKTLTFETNETLHTVYSYYNANDLTTQIGLYDGSPYELAPGTYYICVQTAHDVSTQVTFSLNEQ
jgi:hypothetical protein